MRAISRIENSESPILFNINENILIRSGFMLADTPWRIRNRGIGTGETGARDMAMRPRGNTAHAILTKRAHMIGLNMQGTPNNMPLTLGLIVLQEKQEKEPPFVTDD